MAFPGNFNFNYYVGDTYEFRIYPKDASGAVFDLSGYDTTSGATFTISTSRGSSGYDNRVVCDTEIAADGTYVQCTIFPEQGILLSADEQYVYDVEISKLVSTKQYTYTLLTGNISVTDQVSGATAPGGV